MHSNRYIFAFGRAGLVFSAFLMQVVPFAASAQTPALIGQSADLSSPVVVVVKVPKPWYAPKTLVVGKMRDAIPDYARLKGLVFKAFTFERQSGNYGGVYYWRDAASAQAWFNPAWFERVKKERGNGAQVRFFDAPISIDNTPGGTPANVDSTAVITLVEVPIPAGASREKLGAGFAADAPADQKIPGLLRKHFIVSGSAKADGSLDVNAGATFGGVYIWKDDASAQAWFSPAWHKRMRDNYGQDAKIEWFDAPILLPTLDAGNTLATGLMQVAAP